MGKKRRLNSAKAKFKAKHANHPRMQLLTATILYISACYTFLKDSIEGGQLLLKYKTVAEHDDDDEQPNKHNPTRFH